MMKFLVTIPLLFIFHHINAGYLTNSHPYPLYSNVHSSRNTHSYAVGGRPTSGSHSSIHYSQTVTVPLRISSSISTHHPQEHSRSSHTSSGSGSSPSLTLHLHNVAPVVTARHSSGTHQSSGSSGHINSEAHQNYNIGHRIEIQHSPEQTHHHTSSQRTGAVDGHHNQGHSSMSGGHSSLAYQTVASQGHHNAAVHSSHNGPSASYSNSINYNHGHY